MNIDQLNSISKVPVPDTVFERLQQKIEMAKQDTLSTPKAVLLAATVALVLFTNLFLLNNRQRQVSKASNNNTLVEALELNTNPNLYHE